MKLITTNIVDFSCFARKCIGGGNIQMFWVFVDSQFENCVLCILNFLNFLNCKCFKMIIR
jgi:hypothetical protein